MKSFRIHQNQIIFPLKISLTFDLSPWPIPNRSRWQFPKLASLSPLIVQSLTRPWPLIYHLDLLGNWHHSQGPKAQSFLQDESSQCLQWPWPLTYYQPFLQDKDTILLHTRKLCYNFVSIFLFLIHKIALCIWLTFQRQNRFTWMLSVTECKLSFSFEHHLHNVLFDFLWAIKAVNISHWSWPRWGLILVLIGKDLWYHKYKEIWQECTL